MDCDALLCSATTVMDNRDDADNEDIVGFGFIFLGVVTVFVFFPLML